MLTELKLACPFCCAVQHRFLDDELPIEALRCRECGRRITLLIADTAQKRSLPLESEDVDLSETNAVSGDADTA